MSRCIDADILVQDTIQEYARSKQYRDAIIRMVNKAPTVEPKCGEWINQHEDGHGSWVGTCNQCGKENHVDNYCPNCGCRMKGADDEDD